MRIAVDAMGGDLAPAEVVQGTLAAATEFADTQFILVGDEAAIQAELGTERRDNIVVRHAAQVIGMDDDPAKSIRRKPDSSLTVAARMVADGAAEALFSAGNTGAVTTAAALLIGRLDGVLRPGIATLLPTRARSGWSIVCDVGACVDSKAEWIVQFGVMAAIYAEEVERIPSPRVGLLNIGEESSKGDRESRQAHALFADAGVNWVGNVDGKDVFRGQADVIACDGFNGNSLLKVSEGAAEYFMELVRSAVESTTVSKVGGLLIRPSMRRLRQRIDYTEVGGAFLLGIKGLVVIGHGRSTSKAIFHALRRTREGLQRELVQRLAARFATTANVAVV